MAANRLANPFDYRFGRVPRVWAGRTELLDIIKASMRRSRDEPRRQNLLIGPRGSGKTALIREWYATARKQHWRVVYITAESGELLEAVAQECREVMPLWVRALTSIRRTKVQAAKVALEVTHDDPVRAARLANIIKRLAKRSRRGVLFLVDEAHSVDGEELRSFGNAYQEAEGKVPNKNFAVVLAGLGSLRELVALREESSFFKRLKERELRMLDDAEVEAFLHKALEGVGRTMEPDAIARVVRESTGWPHVMQVVGYHAVNHAGSARQVTLEHVERALPEARTEAAQELLELAWASLTAPTRELLGTLAAHASTTFNALDHWNESDLGYSTYLSRVRTAERSGFIQKVGRERYTFSLPFARRWIQEQVDGAPITDDDLSGDSDDSASCSTGARSEAVERLDRQSSKGQDPRCGWVGERTKLPCLRPKGHRGQHRYG